jgi:hypothetical protein
MLDNYTTFNYPSTVMTTAYRTTEQQMQELKQAQHRLEWLMNKPVPDTTILGRLRLIKLKIDKLKKIAPLFILFFMVQANGMDLVDAVHQVESSGRTTGKIIGDNGKAIGPLQIHKVCWIDAVEYDKTIGGSYQDCHKLEYAKKIFNAYIKRYGKGKTIEQKARIWNGGPSGHKKSATIAYWNKVKKFI